MPKISAIRLDAETINALKLSRPSSALLVSTLKQKLMLSNIDISCFYQGVATKFIEVDSAPSLHVTVEIKLISPTDCIAVIAQIN
jgi:hypothetical protein